MIKRRFKLDPEKGFVDTQKSDVDSMTQFEVLVELNKLNNENEQLKYQNEMLSDELEQCKALIDNRWREYLQKKELEE